LYLILMKTYNRNAQEKSFELSLKIIRLCRHLQLREREYILSKQLLKSGTSIGANLEEAVGSQTDKEMYTKMHIAYREARESKYWLRLINKSAYANDVDTIEIEEGVEELLRILGASISTLKKKLQKP